MPKCKMMKEVQELRQAYKTKIKKYPVATVYLQVIGSGAPGAPRSLYVFTDHCRYLFNCGEGTQRLAYEHKVKLSMMEHIFITHKSWENVGGLPGVLLTLQDTGVPEIWVHGPPGVETIYHDTKNFMRFSHLKINYRHFEDNTFSDEAELGPLEIKTVPIWSSFKQTCTYDSSFLDTTSQQVLELFGRKSKDEEPNTLNSEEKLQESIKSRGLALAYICRPVPKPGALRSELCRQLGVRPGPLMGQLKQGKDVTLANGKVIMAKEVTEAADAGAVFIVIEIPAKEYLPSLESCTTFYSYMDRPGSKEEDQAQCILHFSPHEVIEDKRYQHWMNQYSCGTQHIIINERNRCMGSERVMKIQYKLNHVYPSSFPLLSNGGSGIHFESGCRSKRRRTSGEEGENADGFQCPEDCEDDCKRNVIQASSLLSYHIRPHRKLDRSNMLHLDPERYISEIYNNNNEDFAEIFSNVKMRVKMVASTSDSEKIYPSITFLGTGSCIPSKTRNTSGILIHLNEDSNVILDCGEGTYGQMVRLFGSQTTNDILIKTKAIFVSHLHADHHIGLIRLILARNRAFLLANKEFLHDSKVNLLAPEGILHYLKSYNINFEGILDQIIFVSNQMLNVIHRRKPKEAIVKVEPENVVNKTEKNLIYKSDDVNMDLLDVCRRVHVSRIETCFVHHCPFAYGVAITTLDGYKLVYSGDTLPSENLILLGLGCDLLIHEATMEDDLKEDAILKKHSTASDAIEVGGRMGAKALILTHFSQRYAKVPLLNDGAASRAVVAFDNMTIHPEDLPRLPLLYPAFKSMFSEDYDEMLEKSLKRKARDELNANNR